MSTPQAIVLERRSATGKVFYRTVNGVWNGSDEDKIHLHKQLELLQRDPGVLINNAVMPELNNELSSMFLILWVNAACDYLSQVCFDLLYPNWQELMPILSLVFSALFIVFGSVIIQTFRSPILQFSFINIDKHSRWMDSLFQLTPDARNTDMHHKLDYTGYVLALNGHRRYFCLFTPTSDPRLHHKLDQLNLWMEKLTEGTLDTILMVGLILTSAPKDEEVQYMIERTELSKRILGFHCLGLLELLVFDFENDLFVH